jgi:hypothetical protein
LIVRWTVVHDQKGKSHRIVSFISEVLITWSQNQYNTKNKIVSSKQKVIIASEKGEDEKYSLFW